jgi:hypothetical protein
MPLLYGGQEAGLDKRVAFFERDPIDWRDLSLAVFYRDLLLLKRDLPALWNGSAGGTLEWLPTGNDAVLAFRRRRDASVVSVTLNLSARPQVVAGRSLAPWSWHIEAGARSLSSTTA